MKRISNLLPLSALAVALLVGGCQPANEAPPPEPAPEPAPVAEPEPAPAPVPTSAAATLTARGELPIAGTVSFTPLDDGTLSIVAEVSGVERPGPHGFHLHETGDCTAEDFTSAGGHFNPTGVDHAGPGAEVHHGGDFGNVEIADDGTGRLELVSSMLTLEGENGVIGKAVILHEGEDDLTSQPTGAAGGRLACGVVEGVVESADATMDDGDEPADDGDEAGEGEASEG